MKTTKSLILSTALLMSPLAAQAFSYTDLVGHKGISSSASQSMPAEQITFDDMQGNYTADPYDHGFSNAKSDRMNKGNTENVTLLEHGEITHL